jgi:hypothetical protein
MQQRSPHQLDKLPGGPRGGKLRFNPFTKIARLDDLLEARPEQFAAAAGETTPRPCHIESLLSRARHRRHTT